MKDKKRAAETPSKEQAVEILRAIWEKYYPTICRRFDSEDTMLFLEALATLEKETGT